MLSRTSHYPILSFWFQEWNHHFLSSLAVCSPGPKIQPARLQGHSATWAFQGHLQMSFFILFYFIFYIPYSIPHAPYPIQYVTFHTSSPPQLSSCWSPPILQPTWPLNTLWPPGFWVLGASFQYDHRHGSPLLYMNWGTHISWCMLCVWCSSVWEISAVQINWDSWSFCKIAFPLSYFQPSLIQGLVASLHILVANNCI